TGCPRPRGRRRECRHPSDRGGTSSASSTADGRTHEPRPFLTLRRMTLRAVIKAGGSKGVDRDAVADMVAEVARLDEIVLVHGASAETDRLAAALDGPQGTLRPAAGPAR